jgi:methyl-accepting chemotaxis protein
VAEMDKVIQQNAANAEESASISEEMNAHAEQMKAIVEELVALVGGNPNGAECDASATIKASQAQFHSELAVPAKQIKKLPVHKANKVSPEQIIPMDEDNFKDF